MIWLHLCFCQAEDVFKETAAVHVVVLRLLLYLALLPPPKPQPLLLCRISVSLCVKNGFDTGNDILDVAELEPNQI